MLSHYDGAVSEAQFLHGRDSANQNKTSDSLFFSIFRKTTGRPIQRSYRMPSLESVVSAAIGSEDTYVSQSSFWACSRKAIHFKQTRAAWVDLDLYNIDKKVDSATIAEILKHAEAMGIPTPTAVISSGRGCYLKWIFQVPVTQAQLPVWQSLQATLTAAYSCLAADFKARDASRVLRLLQTKNSKSGALVHTIDGCGVTYDFMGMCQSVESLRLELMLESDDKSKLSLSRKTAKKTTALSARLLDVGQGIRGDIDALNLFTELRRPILMDKLSERSLNWGRFCDLRALYEERGGVPVGQRDQAMFWMLNFLSHAEVIHACDWEGEIAELHKAFPQPETFKPLEDGSMSSLLSRLKHKEAGMTYTWKGKTVSPLYRPSNAFLIKAFEIQPNEMADLKTIISKEEKRARVDEKVFGRSARREERNMWRSEVESAFVGHQEHLKASATVGWAADSELIPISKEAGDVINMTALAKYLGVERTRVTRYWQCLVQQAASGTAEKPTRQRLQKTQVTELSVSLSTSHDALNEVSKKTSMPSTGEVMLEVARLTKLATFKAIEAREEQSRLAFARQGLRMQEVWAQRKLAALTGSQNLQEIDSKEIEKSEDIDMATKRLSKKMQLLEAARALENGQELIPLEASSAPLPERESKVETTVAVVATLTLPADVMPVVAAVAESKLLAELSPTPAAAVATQTDDEGYAAFFGASQSSRWITDSAPSEFTDIYASSATASSEVHAAKAIAVIELKASSALPASSPSISAAERLRLAAQRKTKPEHLKPARSAILPSSEALVSVLPVQAPQTPHAVEPVVATASAGVIVPAKDNSVSKIEAPVPVTPTRPLTATEKLRAISERVSRLPPLQRESKTSEDKKPLVQGGPNAPIRYASKEEWPSDVVAPGSRYTEAEWVAARTDAEGAPCEVIEFQQADQQFLVQLVIPKMTRRAVVVDGKTVQQECAEPSPAVGAPEINSLLRQLYSDCVIVATSSYPTHPGSAEADFTLNSVLYKVIRPRRDYLEADRAYRVGTQMKLNQTQNLVPQNTVLQDGEDANENTSDADVPR